MRNTSYFISDLHLSNKDKSISDRFKAFVDQQLINAERLYILGDLFEYWVGDDGVDLVGMLEIIELLSSLSEAGIEGYFVAGNRDFLVGDAFSKTTGFQILPDFSLIDLYGQSTLILHGDALCTDDIVHQEFRDKIMLNKAWHSEVLNKPLEERVALANQMRGSSNSHKMTLSDAIMDVNEETVKNTFVDFEVQQLIHGHTHRPKRHEYHITLNGSQQSSCERIVLGDWYAQTSYIRANKHGIELINE